MRRLSIASTLTASALLLAACGGAGGAAAPPAQEVPAAMLASMTQPQQVEVSLDVAFDIDELNALAAEFPELDEEVTEGQDEAEMQQALKAMNAFSLSMAMSSDHTSAMAINYETAPLFELRQDPGDLYGLQQFDELLAAPPSDVTLLMRIDEAVIRDVAALFEAPMPPGSFSDMLEAALSTDAFGIPEQLANVARAMARSEWAGITGQLDLAGFFEAMGIDDATLEMMAPNEAQVPDAEDVLRLVTDSVTFTREDGATGEATYLGDLDADTFVRGLAAMLAQTDTTGMFESMMVDGLDELSLPLLDDAVTVTFAGDLLTSLTINGTAIMAEIAIAESDLTEERANELRQRVRALQGTRANLVVTFRDHGKVGNQLEGIDAVTIQWEELEGLAAQFAPLMMMGGMGGMGMGGMALGSMPMGVDTSTTISSSDAGGSDGEELLKSALRNFAVEQETWFTDHQTYTENLEDLPSATQLPDGVFVIISRADDTSFCMEAFGEDGLVWSYDSATSPQLQPGLCS